MTDEEASQLILKRSLISIYVAEMKAASSGQPDLRQPGQETGQVALPFHPRPAAADEEPPKKKRKTSRCNRYRNFHTDECRQPPCSACSEYHNRRVPCFADLPSMQRLERMIPNLDPSPQIAEANVAFVRSTLAQVELERQRKRK